MISHYFTYCVWGKTSVQISHKGQLSLELVGYTVKFLINGEHWSTITTFNSVGNIMESLLENT